MAENYSLLAQCPKPGSIGVALAHMIAPLKRGRDSDRLDLLGRIAVNIKPVERLAMMAELHLCRQAQRSEIEAQII